MRPKLILSTDGNEFYIEIHNLFEKHAFQIFSFTEPEPTEHNIKLHIQRLFDILRDKAQTERQKIKIDRFFSDVKSRVNLLDVVKIEE